MPQGVVTGGRLDDATRAIIISLRQSGHSQQDISARVGASRQAVRAVIALAGLNPSKPKPKPAPGKAVDQANKPARELGNQLHSQAAPTAQSSVIQSSPQNTQFAAQLRTNMQDRLADRTHKFVDTLTDERIEEVSVVQAVSCINKLIDANTKLQKVQQDLDVTDSLTALLVHATRRREEMLTPFPKITTVVPMMPEEE